jgi:putative inorganic carbon (hco3(-)) transporter
VPPKFTIFWILTFASFLLSSVLINPVYGTFAYLFEYYLRPDLHWWGKGHLPDLRWNFLASLVLATTYLMHKSQLPDIGPFAKGPAKFLVALCVYMLVFSNFAISPSASWSTVDQYSKLILFHFLVIATVRWNWAFDVLMALHIGGAGWWGYEAWRNPRREASRLYAVGSGDTWNDNFASAHLLTVLPFVFVYLLKHPDKRLRLLALVAGPYIINTLILCNSRGAMVGLAAALLYSMVFAKKGQRIKMVFGAAAVVGMFLFLSDDEFITRQQTTTSYEQDGSAQSRLATWAAGIDLLKDYPLGAGGKGFDLLSPIYAPHVVAAHHGELRAPHNTFIEVSSEWGIPGLIFFCGYFFMCFRLMWQVRKRAPEGGIWYYRAVGVELSMVAYLVAGMFVDRTYGEATYWIGAFAVVVHRLQAHELSKQAGAPAVAPQPAPVMLPPINLPPVAAHSTQTMSRGGA